MSLANKIGVKPEELLRVTYELCNILEERKNVRHSLEEFYKERGPKLFAASFIILFRILHEMIQDRFVETSPYVSGVITGVNIGIALFINTMSEAILWLTEHLREPKTLEYMITILYQLSKSDIDFALVANHITL